MNNKKLRVIDILLKVLLRMFEIAFTIAGIMIKGIIVFFLIFVAAICDSQDSI